MAIVEKCNNFMLDFNILLFFKGKIFDGRKYSLACWRLSAALVE
jgi:hypothetical protein